MQKVIFLVLYLVLSISATASPLLFKVTKENVTDGKLDLGSFDALKYRQIRIGVRIEPNPVLGCALDPVQRAKAEVNLEYAQKSFDRNKVLFNQGDISKAEFDQYADMLKDADSILRSISKYPCPIVSVTAGELSESVGLTSLTMSSNFLLLDSPPSKLFFTGYGRGKYTIMIWGQ